MKKHVPTIYLIIFLLILIIPSLGMAVFGPSDPENDEQAGFPSIVSEEGEINLQYLQQAGDWFESRFAFRKQMVTAYSLVLGNVFDTSSIPGVVTGTNGWLYYADTIPDYQRTSIMTGRQLHNAVRHVYLVNEYCENNDIEFFLVIAPDKNTLYPEQMPYYYPAGEGDSNMFLLMQALEIERIPHSNLWMTFEEEEGTFYFARDSHWNNMGAAMAAHEILSSIGVDHTNYRMMPYSIERIHQGDLEQMIYPGAVRPEEDYVFDTPPVFTYDAPVQSNFDFRIQTTGTGTEDLLMYRDSFGSSLLPFMAEPFDNALFSRSNACQINDLLSVNPDVLIIEKAERFIFQFYSTASRLPSPLRDLPDNAVEITPESLSTAQAGEYVTITGTLPDGSYEDDSIILIVSGDNCFEAYPVTDIANGTEGFQSLLEKNLISTDNIRVFIV